MSAEAEMEERLGQARVEVSDALTAAGFDVVASEEDDDPHSVRYYDAEWQHEIVVTVGPG